MTSCKLTDGKGGYFPYQEQVTFFKKVTVSGIQFISTGNLGIYTKFVKYWFLGGWFELWTCGIHEVWNFQIVLYHARWVKMQNRMQQHLIFSFSFHANFIDPNTRLMELNRGDVDHQADDDSKFGEPLR